MQQHNQKQEIVGLGLANFAGSAFNAYSTTGSFSRSAVNYDSGLALRLVVVCCVVLCCVLCCVCGPWISSSVTHTHTHMQHTRNTSNTQKTPHPHTKKHTHTQKTNTHTPKNTPLGCKTPLSGFITGLVVMLVLLVMTPVFEKLPLNVMGAIVVSEFV